MTETELERKQKKAKQMLVNDSWEHLRKAGKKPYDDRFQAFHNRRINDKDFLFWFARDLSILIENRSMTYPPGMKEYIDNRIWEKE